MVDAAATGYFWVSFVAGLVGVVALGLSIFKHFRYAIPYQRFVSTKTGKEFDGNLSAFSVKHPLQSATLWLVFFGLFAVDGCPRILDLVHLSAWILFSLLDRTQDCIRSYALYFQRVSVYGSDPSSSDKSSADSTIYALIVIIYLVMFLFYVFSVWFVRAGFFYRIISYRPEAAAFFDFTESMGRVRFTNVLLTWSMRLWVAANVVYGIYRFAWTVALGYPVWWAIFRFLFGTPLSIICSSSMFLLMFSVSGYLLIEVSLTKAKLVEVYAALRDQARGFPPHRKLLDAFQPSLFFHTYAYLVAKIQMTGNKLSGILFLACFVFVIQFTLILVRFLSFGRNLQQIAEDLVSHASDFLVAVPLLLIVLSFALVSSRMNSVLVTSQMTLGYFVMNGYKAVKQADVLVMIQSIGNLPYAFHIGGILLDNGSVVKGFSLFFSLGAAIIAFYDYTTK
eukprot:ANDGO_04510.mRNA.1 hypothetical protein